MFAKDQTLFAQGQPLEHKLLPKEKRFHQVNLKYLTNSGFPQDYFQSIDNPKFRKPKLGEDNVIGIGVTFGGISKFYPLSIMTKHQIINDKFGSHRISVTYCPISKTAVAFKNRNFGVSDRIYNNNLVMYDRAFIHRNEAKMYNSSKELENKYQMSLISQVLRLELYQKRSLNHITVPAIICGLRQWWIKFPRTIILNEHYIKNAYNPYDNNREVLHPLIPINAKIRKEADPKSPTLMITDGFDTKLIIYDGWKDPPEEIWKLLEHMKMRKGLPIILQGYWFQLASLFLT
jgi:hypothetical protein